MIDPIVYLTFLPAAFALVLTPGPDMLFAMAQGLRGGKGPAVAASAGIASGAFINAGLAGLGLGALVAAAPWVFGVVRWVGVAYLLYLAFRTLMSPLVGENTRPVRPSRAFRDGLVVNLSNPSVILFILAFIPQFVDPTGAILPQFLIYGGTIAVLGFAVKSGVGLTAGGLGRALARTPIIERVLRWITAGVFGALAARVALAGARP
ncbi:LysE family translocator [uncultured Tateyamaria sp.]|uniref:LysE family translocator n=1 Tax=uncultured Tateyamaria sp. TaxID=455651 RepID=UPI002624D419|nr:LysE family translocator [uncultured Tateyamaria sp.]